MILRFLRYDDIDIYVYPLHISYVMIAKLVFHSWVSLIDLSFSPSPKRPNMVFWIVQYLYLYLFCEIYQVCLDYWNVLVSELFEPQRSLENPAAANMIGLQVLSL